MEAAAVDNNLYSIILDFRGGTYIAQVSDLSPEDAIARWAKALSDTDAHEWKLDKRELERIVHDGSVVALSDYESVWCLSGSIGNHLVLINVVQTAREGRGRP